MAQIVGTVNGSTRYQFRGIQTFRTAVVGIFIAMLISVI